MLASAVLGVLTICPNLGAPPPGPSTDGLAAVRAVLRRSEGATAARDDVLVRRLVALGSDAAPTLFSLATGAGIEALMGDGDDDEAWMCPPDHVSGLALAALADLPAVPVREFLRSQCRAQPSPEVRLVALEVLGRQASAEGLDLCFELLEASGDELENRSLLAAGSEALLSMVRKDSAAAAALERLVGGASVTTQRLVCEALAQCNRPAAVRILAKLFGRDPELDLAVLEALTRIGERFPWRVGDDVATRLRPALGRGTPALRAGVARALGRIGDVSSIGALVGQLSDADPSIQRAAQWALHEISGETRTRTPEEWQRWFQAESSWWKEQGPGWLEAIDPDEPARLSEAMRELVHHPLARESTVDALAEAMSGLDPAAKLVATGALARLGSRRAVPALIECLYDPSAELRTSAWQALRSLTGEDLPAEPQLWETYAFD
jgi:HEAT repeat protein